MDLDFGMFPPTQLVILFHMAIADEGHRWDNVTKIAKIARKGTGPFETKFTCRQN